MQVVVPLVVFDQLGKGIRLAQEFVDKVDDALLVQLPESAQPWAKIPDCLQLGA